MYDKIMERYGLETKDHALMRAKNLLQYWIEGSHNESYSRLLEYIEEIKLKKPESMCSCIAQSPKRAPLFKMIFISFKSTVVGLLSGYRPFIGVNGCFLKGPFKGVY